MDEHTIQLRRINMRNVEASDHVELTIPEFYELYGGLMPTWLFNQAHTRETLAHFLSSKTSRQSDWDIGDTTVRVSRSLHDDLEYERDEASRLSHPVGSGDEAARESEHLHSHERAFEPAYTDYRSEVLNSRQSHNAPWDTGYSFGRANSDRADRSTGRRSPYMPTSMDQMYGSQDKLNQLNYQNRGIYRHASLRPQNLMGGKGCEIEDVLNEVEMDNKLVESIEISWSRRLWIMFVWACTFWIPSFALRWIGRMKRPDVQMAWREKVTIFFMISFFCCLVLFIIIFLGRIICPNFDKAWNPTDVSKHQGENDFYVSLRGSVYDISKFWKLQHSDTTTLTSSANMLPFAGQDMTVYFPYPLTQSCPGLVNEPSLSLQINYTEAVYREAIHYIGPRLQPVATSKLRDIRFYQDVLMPRMKNYRKGDLVYTPDDLAKLTLSTLKNYVILNSTVYDFTPYFATRKIFPADDRYAFFDKSLEDLIHSNPGGDIAAGWSKLPLNKTMKALSLACMNHQFYAGILDFRKSSRCLSTNYLLLGFTIIICLVLLSKFLAALQFGTRYESSVQDKFVICQVPAFTESEDQLRRTIDSLTYLDYHDQRKLMFIICDGVVTGSGNDYSTPEIILSILGLDPALDPPAMPYKAIAEGAGQLNYAKVYSGLYEYEGHIVPYVVVVKVGRPEEKSKPGNRGKRDSQMILLNFLSRVFYQSEMTPLELEIYHHISNIIGLDPSLYEYILQVDSDTEVGPNSLTQLVSSCIFDSKVIAICGETSLQNAQSSWWTMIQVYEYFISHHLAKSFESLFGSVTCLPGCFSLLRVRSSDGRKPLVVDKKVVYDYGRGNADTLHTKNLLHLGEDRYFTTLLLKYFPYMKTKFTPCANARTVAPEKWRILLSQRRRWINSTIHNLGELAYLGDMCGFCCFSMRFIVFIDLFGTVLLPATVVYLGYLLYLVITKSGQLPLISLILLAAVYGLQIIIFILKRHWEHIGWMIIYLMAYPLYSFVIPIYSFWHMDDFNWGSTRIVVGEKGAKAVVLESDHFDERSVPMRRWPDCEYYREVDYDEQERHLM